MDTRKIVDYAQDGNAVGVREELYAAIWDRVHAAIESKKQQIAQGLVTQESYEGPGDDEEEDDWDEEDEQIDEGSFMKSVHKRVAKNDAEKYTQYAKQDVEKGHTAGAKLYGKAAKHSMKKANEAYDDDEDPDVRIADKELKKRGISLPKVKVDPDKDMARLAKRTPKEKEED
jgi:hypothetical protein